MAAVLDALVNLLRLLRNVRARLLGRPPDFVWLDVSGSLPEFEARPGFLRRRFSPFPAGAPAPSLEGFRNRLDRITADGRPRGVVLRVRGLDAGWATLEELRRELERFRGRGGRVVAHLVEADTRAYYLACAADEVYATPQTTLAAVGLRARVDFVKDALDRVGLDAEVFAVSPYKSAYDRFVRQDFSEESREQTERLLDRRFGALLDAVARGRDLSPEEAREKIDGAPYAAPAAVGAGLLDGALYEDELPGRLGADGGRATLAEWGRAVRALKVPYRRTPRRAVGVVSVTGAITRGRSRRLPVPLPLVGREQAGDESVAAALRVAEGSRRVGAVLLHVDSPGGDALASDLIWNEVRRVRRKKPVVVLMGDAAASGGYYVAAPAGHVVARANTVTGSIGVLILRPTTSRLYAGLGVNPVSLTRGARAGVFDPSQPLDPDERRVLQDQLRTSYEGFKDRVVRGRCISHEELERVAGGRVWTGAEARELGLVDEVGGFREALAKARELAGIKPGGPDALLKITPPRNARPAPGEPAGESVGELVEELADAVAGLRRPGVWAVAPYAVVEER